MINRNSAPPFIEPAFFQIKEAESEVLAGGIPFHFINSGETELLRIEIIFNAGKWYQLKKGQANLTSKMLLEGTKSYSSEEISRVFERNGAFFEISSGMDHINFTVFTLNRNVPQLLPVINEVINDPSFPIKELQRLKDIQIQNLKVNLKKNGFLASRFFREKLFSKNHPYGEMVDIKDIDLISESDLQEYFSNCIKNNFEVIVSGKINPSDLDLLKSFFNDTVLKRIDSPSYTFDEMPAHQFYHEIADSLQTSLKIGCKTMPKNDPRYFHLLIFNEILGGYFGSRLMQKIREEKGYSYGIHSSIIQHTHGAYFVISSDVIKEYRKDAIQSIYDEINQLIQMEVPEEELHTVINYFKGSFLSSINSPYALADKFKNIHYNGLTYEFYSNLFKELDAITPGSLQNFTSDYISNLTFTEVAVG